MTDETTTSARRRRLVALPAALLVLSVFLGSAAVAAPCATDVPGSWRTIAPSFPEGLPEAVSFSTMPSNPDVLFVANARSIVRSRDGGCTFHDAVTLGEMGFAAADRIVQVLVVPDDAGRVYALVQEDAGGLPRPHVLRSSNGGADWSRGDGGLAAVFGPPRAIVAARSDGPLYLLVGPADVSLGDDRVATAWSLHRSQDLGQSWVRRADVARQLTLDPVVPNEPQDIRDLVLDPFDDEDLWLFGPSGLYRSRDGGETLAPMIADRPVSAVSIFKTFSDVPLTMAFDAERPIGYRLVGEAATPVRVPLPAIVDSAGTGRATYEQVHSTAVGDVIHAPSVLSSFTDISAAVPGHDVQTSLVNAARDLVVQARTKRGVIRRLLPGPLIEGPGGIGDFPPPVDAEFATPELRPGVNEVVLGPGERRDVPVRLFLPGAHRVDVLFLIDTSGSMGEEIAGVRSSIAAIQRELVKAGVDAWFGLAQYRGASPGYSPPGQALAYDLVYDVARPGKGIDAALSDLGAGGTGEESILAAMRQAVVGDGIPSAGVPAGQQAHFRPGALPVLLHLGDETFHENRGVNPSIEGVAAILKAAGVLQVGLAFQEEPGLLPSAENNPRDGMEEMARLTGAVAPDSGADCDGDDAADRQSGDPMVCVIDPSRSAEASVIAPAIVGLLVGLARDPVTIGLEAKGPPGVVVEAPPGLGERDLTISQQLGYYVTVTCPESVLGRTVDVSLRAFGRESAVLDTASFGVVCGTRALPPPPPPLPPVLAQIPPAPQPVPQQGPQSQPQPHAQGAFAAQRQQQPQLAYGYVNPARPQAEPVPAREDRFEMSSAGDPSAVPPAATYLTGAAMAVAAVALARRRTRTAPALARATTPDGARARLTIQDRTRRRSTWR